MTLTYECGCVNQIDIRCGALRSLVKCDHHKAMQREIGELSEEYYRELGALDDDASQRYRLQFEECLGLVPECDGLVQLSVLEIGAGCSPYRPMFKGWDYWACEPSLWACQWLNDRYSGANVWHGALDSFWDKSVRGGYRHDAILSAHSLEHMADAPEALCKMADLVRPGGVLYLILPDDTDPLNPDHLWFFNRTTLASAVSLAGFAVDVIESRKRIDRENFLYCRACRRKIS